MNGSILETPESKATSEGRKQAGQDETSKKKEPGFAFYFVAAVIFGFLCPFLVSIASGASVSDAARNGGLFIGILFSAIFFGGAVIGMFDQSKGPSQ